MAACKNCYCCSGNKRVKSPLHYGVCVYIDIYLYMYRYISIYILHTHTHLFSPEDIRPLSRGMYSSFPIPWCWAALMMQRVWLVGRRQLYSLPQCTVNAGNHCDIPKGWVHNVLGSEKVGCMN